MSDAPERIWAWIWHEERSIIGSWVRGDKPDAKVVGVPITEYLRADIAAASEATLRAEIDALREDKSALEVSRGMLGRYWAEAGADNTRLREMLNEALDGLIVIDALDPEDMVSACSDAAARGIVLRMGDIARATIAKIGGTHG
jgi:hypothetical protein